MKKTHTNMIRKHAYKRMKKKPIQMYKKNSHTIVYKCMEKKKNSFMVKREIQRKRNHYNRADGHI